MSFTKLAESLNQFSGEIKIFKFFIKMQESDIMKGSADVTQPLYTHSEKNLYLFQKLYVCSSYVSTKFTYLAPRITFKYITRTRDGGIVISFNFPTTLTTNP